MIKINHLTSAFDNLATLVTANQTEQLPHDLHEDNIEFSTPAEFQGEGINNTEVTITALLDQGYSGSVTVNYYRPTLDEVKTTPEDQIEVNTLIYDEDDAEGTREAYEAHVLTQIANALELNVEEIEFVSPGSVPVPFSENTPETVDVRPVATSLIYSGAAITVTFTAIDTDVDLESVILVTELSGFEF